MFKIGHTVVSVLFSYYETTFGRTGEYSIGYTWEKWQINSKFKILNHLDANSRHSSCFILYSPVMHKTIQVPDHAMNQFKIINLIDCSKLWKEINV